MSDSTNPRQNETASRRQSVAERKSAETGTVGNVPAAFQAEPYASLWRGRPLFQDCLWELWLDEVEAGMSIWR